MKRLIGGTALAVAMLALACVVVPVRRPGGATDVMTDEPSETMAAAEAAAFLAPRLDSLLDRLTARRGGLPPAASSVYPEAARRLIEDAAEEVIALLDEQALDSKPRVESEDLAALRDFVRGAEADALAELGWGRGATARSFSAIAGIDRGARGVILPAQRRERGQDAVDDFLSALRNLSRRAAASDLQTTLCAISDPIGGRFEVFPASSPRRARETLAIGTLANLWRGTYMYRVEIDGVSHEGRNLDLVAPDRLTLECIRDAAMIACREHARLLDPCRAR